MEKEEENLHLSLAKYWNCRCTYSETVRHSGNIGIRREIIQRGEEILLGGCLAVLKKGE